VAIESTGAACWAMLRRIAVFAAAIDVGFVLLCSALGATALALLLFVPGIVVGSPHRGALPLMALLLASCAGLYGACKAWAPLSPLPAAHLEVAR
jgi:hypothetical protein